MVESIQDIEVQLFQEYVKQQMPIKIRNIPNTWMATQYWNPTRYGDSPAIQHYLDTEVSLMYKTVEEQYFSGDIRFSNAIKLKFGEFLSRMQVQDKKRRNLYLCQCSIYSGVGTIQPELPKLMDDIQFPGLLKDVQLEQINVWVNLCASSSDLHYDSNHNVLVVISGRKTLRLFPPSAASDIDIYPSYKISANHAKSIDVRKDSINVVLQPGDSIFIPEGWWHQVDSDENTFAINFWFHGLRSKICDLDHMHEYYIRSIVSRKLLLKRKSSIEHAVFAAKNNVSVLDTIDHTCAFIASTNDDSIVEQVLLIVETPMLNVVIMNLAERWPHVWSNILQNASPLLVEYLTEHWELQVGVNDEFYTTIFGVLESDGVDVRSELCAKKEQYSRNCYRSIMKCISHVA